MDAFFLSDTYLLRGATIGDIDSVQSISKLLEFGDGEAILAERDQAQDIMIVTEGRVRVATREGNVIDELRRGDMIGEISFLDGQSRTATVTAVGTANVLEIPADRLRDLMKKSPSLEVVILRNVALALCKRLRSSNQSAESPLVPH